MDTKQKKSILKKYLGGFPAWFDLRKKEIVNDNINIEQWQINMNFLIYKHGTIDPSEKKAFKDWTETFYNTGSDEIKYEGWYLEEHATPVLLNISDVDLPPILCRDRDRNWFLAAYPDVFEYFYPQKDLRKLSFYPQEDLEKLSDEEMEERIRLLQQARLVKGGTPTTVKSDKEKQQTNLLAADFDAERRRVEDLVKAVATDFERMEQYLTTGKGNQTIYLIRMKNFYKNELKKNLLLCR